VDELILFIIFLVFSFLRSLPGGRKTAPPGYPASPAGRPGTVLPHPRELVLRLPGELGAGGAEVSRPERLFKRQPEPPRTESLPDSVTLQAAQSVVTADEPEHEGETFFQLDRDTVLLGLVFSEILREPRARHRRLRPTDIYR